MFMVISKRGNDIKAAPLYIHSFKFLIPLNTTKSERFFNEYPTIDSTSCTANKLRYYRYKKALLQRDVADYAGIDRETYVNYENVNHVFYKREKLERIAEILEVSIFDLLDEYNAFIYSGQGKRIKEIRKSLGLTQHSFGKIFSVSGSNVKRWEADKVQITKTTYDKLLAISCI